MRAIGRYELCITQRRSKPAIKGAAAARNAPQELALLARRLNTTPRSVNRLVDLHRSTKIDTLAEALHAPGAELEVGLTAAA